MEKKPFVTKEKIEEIINSGHPTPFHIYDEKGIRENARKVNKAFSWNKGYKEYFAVKALPNPFILSILKEEGCGVDCSSMAELKMSDTCGFFGHDIMFSSNDTPLEEFSYCASLGGIINIDDFTQVEKVEKTLNGFPDTVCCRFNPGGIYEVSNGIMDNPGDAKYGMTEEQIIEAYKYLKEKGVKTFGLHAFLVSNTVSNDYYPELSKTLFKLAVKIKKEAGVSLSFINLSGGVGIPYRPSDTPNDISIIGEGVHKVFDEILTPNGLGDISIFTEMGRFMTGPFGALVTTAINEKHIYKEYIGVDACAANLMRPAMYGAYHHITVLGKENEPLDHKYDVTGSLCENNDKFAIDRELPKIDMGDILYIHDTGAHGFAMGYNYNGRLWSEEILLHEDSSFEMIRRAETLNDYFATFDCFPRYKGLFQG